MVEMMQRNLLQKGVEQSTRREREATRRNASCCVHIPAALEKKFIRYTKEVRKGDRFIVFVSRGRQDS
ncbi:hypothetical protein DAI22_08g149500 [Oryza sativa Japonica Group]|nr:hypothetical protein DAI22_08g149500 [Oryza sativa Japonica Group]